MAKRPFYLESCCQESQSIEATIFYICKQKKDKTFKRQKIQYKTEKMLKKDQGEGNSCQKREKGSSARLR